MTAPKVKFHIVSEVDGVKSNVGEFHGNSPDDCWGAIYWYLEAGQTPPEMEPYDRIREERAKAASIGISHTGQ